MQEIVLAVGPHQVEVQAGLRLGGDAAEDVEVDHQQVVGALQHRIVHHPQCLGQAAGEACGHHGVVEVAKYREGGVFVLAVAVPDVFQGATAGLGLAVGLTAQFQVAVHCMHAFFPVRIHGDQAFFLGHQHQVREDAGEVVGVRHRQVRLRVLERYPELVLDYVGGDLSGADRAADESGNEVFGVVQHEAVAGPRGNVVERRHRVHGIGAGVVRQLADFPVPGQEQLPEEVHAVRVQRVGHVGLVYQGGDNRAQAIEKDVTRIVVGAQGGDDIYRLPRGCGGAHQFKEGAGIQFAEVQVRRVQVFVEVARHQFVPRRGFIEKGLPGGDLRLFPGARFPGLLVDYGALENPLAQGLEFSFAEAAQGQRHALPGFLAGVLVELAGGGALVVALQAQFDVFRHRRIAGQRLHPAQLDHVVQQRVHQVVVQGAALVVEHGIEALLAPLGLAVGVHEQPGWLGVQYPRAVVYRLGGGAAQQARAGAQFQLAGCVITGVAGDALGIQYGFYVLAPGVSLGPGNGWLHHLLLHHRLGTGGEGRAQGEYRETAQEGGQGS